MSGVLHKVGVIGAGTMGLGIAQIVAMAGYNVQLYDTVPGSVEIAINRIARNLQQGIEKGKVTQEEKHEVLNNISVTAQLRELEADFVIEAIVEDLEVKQQLFKELEKILSEKAIFCTNTSSISVTKVAAALQFRQRFLGMHFFNPAHIMKLVEVVSASETDAQVLSRAINFVEKLGKTPVIAKDSPGFIVNRVARHYYVESLCVLEEQVAAIEDIDRLLEATGFKMGPFRLMDLIGIDTNFAVTSTMYEGFHQAAKFRPSRIQEQKVTAGHHGRKSGRGFYSYDKA
jgi:3-hydroxybutyryl-CoA dehydrogenase